MTGRIVFRIFLGLIVIALLAGAGARLYHIGVARGLALAPQLADRLPPGAPLMPYAPYGPWGYRPFGWGFGFGFFFPVLFFFGIWFLISRLFFWCRWGGWGGRGNWEERRRMLDEWHRRAHGWGPNEGPRQQSSSPQG